MGCFNSKQALPSTQLTYSKLSQKLQNSHNAPEGEITFTAEGENCLAERIILYEPGMEVFLSFLHPKASLYEKTTTRKKVKESYNNFVKQLHKNDIIVHNVRDVLKLDHASLLNLASKSLKYEYVSDDINEDIEEYITTGYKNSVLAELDDNDLIDIILCQPVIEVSSCDINTGINIEYIKLKPVGNLVFCRDQQITTNKGVIIGHLNSSQRQFETEIMKLVFKNLNINIIGQIPNKYHLEGGDFIPINKNLSMLGVGLRTDFGAAQYLMDNDLLGTERFAVVIDENDKNQDRMHLDTVFNVLNHDTVIALDFDTVPHPQSAAEEKENIDISRKVNIYQKNNNENNNKYELIEQDIDFYDFLKNEGFNIIKVNHEKQLKYIINFINIGNGNIITVNEDLKGLVDSDKIKVEYVEFDGVKAMYGAAHCATQVCRVRTRQ